MEAEVKQTIEQYKQEAESQGSPDCCCPGCQQKAPGYRPHDRRRRQFYVVAGNWVHRFFTTLIRWKCVLCKTTFTFYPSFCVPYKRFVLAVITRLSGRYVEEDEASYRSVIRCRGMAIGYADEPATDKQLSPATVWRWLGGLGCNLRLQAGLRLIREKAPDLALQGRYYLRQSLDILIDSLLRAWTQQGLPNELYLDNAKVYHANALKAACYGLHIRLIHRKPRDPAPGGLVERLFRTNQQQFEAEVRAGDILTLNQLNRAFGAWLSVAYHPVRHTELNDTPLNRFEQGIHRPIDRDQAIRFFMHQKTRTVHRDFSDVSIDGAFYRVDRQYRGDRVIVRYDPFSIMDQVLVYSEADQYLTTAEHYHRDIMDDCQPQPQPKPQYNYLDMIVEQHDKKLDTQAKGIDFTQLTHARWPFASFSQTLARLLGNKGGISAFSAEQIETLKAAYDTLPALSEARLITAVEQAQVKNLHHILWQLQQQSEK